MAFNTWTSSIVDAPYDVIEGEIRRILNGAPLPNISESMVLFNLSWADCPQYAQTYLSLQKWYITEVIDSHDRNLNEYGFSEWESPHPFLNTMNKIFNPYHWYHMKRIVTEIERSVRINEIESRQKYDPKDRLELITAKAIQQRKYEYDIELDNGTAVSRRKLDERCAQSDENWRTINAAMAERSNPTNKRPSVGEQASNFYNNNPFWSGVVGALLYHKVKDTFGNK